MYRYKLILSYDGSEYAGWQIQPNAPTIQMHLEHNLALLTKEKPRVTASGRTDAGVHAINQVVHFSLEKERESALIKKALNGMLPMTIRIKEVHRVEEDFHARYSAKKKHYQYFLHLGDVSDPFSRRYRLFVKQSLDLAAMKKAASLLEGTHDFSAFANEVGPNAKKPNPVKTIYAIDFSHIPQGIRIDFWGNGFLYKMVRNITGTLLECGKGKITPEQVFEILQTKDRKKAPAAAPACGLFLANVFYNSSQKIQETDLPLS